jgi:hypothetical protein
MNILTSLAVDSPENSPFWNVILPKLERGDSNVLNILHPRSVRSFMSHSSRSTSAEYSEQAFTSSRLEGELTVIWEKPGRAKKERIKQHRKMPMIGRFFIMESFPAKRMLGN